MTPDREPRDGESRDREGGIRPVPPHVDPVPEGKLPEAVTVGDRVRIDQTDRDEPIIGTVRDVLTEWGRVGLVIDVDDADRDLDPTVWQRADREISKLPDREPDGGRAMTDGGRP